MVGQGRDRRGALRMANEQGIAVLGLFLHYRLNGHPLMGAISGTGCMASSVTGAFAATTDDRFATTVAALATFLAIRVAQRAIRAAQPPQHPTDLHADTADATE